MLKLYRYFLSLLFIVFVLSQSVAQTVRGVEAKIVDDNIVVTYTVTGIRDTQLFDVQLLSSHNNFASPLTGANIEGASGNRIPLKSANSITIKNPLEVLQGVTNVNFRVKVNMVYFPVDVTSPATSFAQKKKKMMEVNWQGGLKNEPVKFDLYRFDELILDDFHTAMNTNATEFKMPNVEKGDGYVMKMEFGSLNSPIELPNMRVKPKKSIVARIINITLLLAVVDFALYATGPSEVPASELGGFIFKNFDPMGKGVEVPPMDPTLPDAPSPATIFSFRF